MIFKGWQQPLKPAAPPFVPWAPFTLTAGTSIDWVGYVSPNFDLVNPAGSITNEPSSTSTLRYLVYDPAVNYILMSLTGNVVTEVLAKTLYIGMVPFLPLGAQYVPAENSTAVYYPGTISLVAGQTYPIQFIQTPVWTPLDLGAKLLGRYDAEAFSSITESSGIVSSWRDTVTGLEVGQSTSASRPSYNATGLNGRPAVIFDGTDDFLYASSGATYPSGTAPNEVWGLVNQQTPATDAPLRYLAVQGAINSANSDRRCSRAVQGSLNRVQTRGSTGSSVLAIADTSGDYVGVHAARHVFADTLGAYMDNGAGGTGALVLNAGGSRFAIGGLATGAPSSVWHGPINSIFITAPLTTDEAANMWTFLKNRGGLA